MMHQFDVEIDVAATKAAWRAWFFRTGVRWKIPLLVALTFLSVSRSFASGNVGLFPIVLVTVTALVVFGVVLAYFSGLRRSLALRRSVPDARATYRLTEEKLEAGSGLGSLSWTWAALAELRRAGNLVLIGYQGGAYSTVPVAQVPEEALAFLLERCRSAGVRIIGF